MAIVTGQTILAADVVVKAQLVVADSEVYSGNSPTNWTDLDLNATVGANLALVLLRITAGAISMSAYAFRANGDAEEYFTADAASEQSGVNKGHDATAALAHLHLVNTDAAGVIEWRTEVATACVIDVVAYIIQGG